MPIAACAVSLLLFFAAIAQEMTPYPYNLRMPATANEAREMILAHPALPTPRLYLLSLMEKEAPAEWEMRELEAALRLDPTNPHLRDLYAGALLAAGKRKEGLEQIAYSVQLSPSLSEHVYLSDRFLPYLSEEEKDVVQDGFEKALAADFEGAVAGLAAFYAKTGRFAEQAELLAKAAERPGDPATRADFAFRSAMSYLKAGESKRAEELLRKAIALVPDDARPYRLLASEIYGPEKRIREIDEIITAGAKSGAPAFDLYLARAEGMKIAGEGQRSEAALEAAEDALAGANGREPYPLYIALAEAAQKLGFRDRAKQALAKALDYRPASPEALNRLAHLHLQDRSFDRAAYYFRSIVNSDPTASDAYYHLAVAEEGQYRFAAAAEAYRRAIELAPQNSTYRDRYEAFKAKVEQNRLKLLP